MGATPGRVGARGAARPGASCAPKGSRRREIRGVWEDAVATPGGGGARPALFATCPGARAGKGIGPFPQPAPAPAERDGSGAPDRYLPPAAGGLPESTTTVPSSGAPIAATASHRDRQRHRCRICRPTISQPAASLGGARRSARAGPDVVAALQASRGHRIAEQTAISTDVGCAIIWRNKNSSAPFVAQ